MKSIFQARGLEFGGLGRLLITMDPSQGLLDLFQNSNKKKYRKMHRTSTLVNNRKGLGRALGIWESGLDH